MFGSQKFFCTKMICIFKLFKLKHLMDFDRKGQTFQSCLSFQSFTPFFTAELLKYVNIVINLAF